MLYQVHLYGLRRVVYMHWCIYRLLPPIIGIKEEETLWCCWLVNLVLPVGKSEETLVLLVGAVWLLLLLLFVF